MQFAISKPGVPAPPPRVQTLREFGERIGWRTGDSAAIARIKTLTLADLSALGMTPDLAADWREFYCAIKRWSPSNPSAAGRAALMHRVWRMATRSPLNQPPINP